MSTSNEPVFAWDAASVVAQRKPLLWTAKFGDGYQQNVPQGLNSQPGHWTLQLHCASSAEADAIDTFLQEQGGYLPFAWTPPHAATPVSVLCQNWSKYDKPGGVVSITATFEQVFGA
ncbi:phage tail protein [Pandoraea pnomenusa]|uniref:phage tail protein n=1 Tax=Pandoraea pnomenusa TaxID=93220 RepID=UPI0003D222AA|nr:phage tail protein [Pandoraea pnomenusa]AHB77251.1 hypothetical protein X636_18710 [Pandoraea pnomenusa]